MNRRLGRSRPWRTHPITVPALAWLGRSSEQAQLDGVGPIDLETAKGLAGAATSFRRVLTDPVAGVLMASGVALLGSVTALLASWLLEQVNSAKAATARTGRAAERSEEPRRTPRHL